MPTPAPSLTFQIGSLYASGVTSTFTGTGGPYGFSPWTSQFGGVVSSAGLATEPFADTVYNVAAGDELIFVLAVQNTGNASASGVTVGATLPAGFAVPGSGLNLSVTDGTGAVLAFSGDPFSAGGLQIGAAVAAYDANSGQNVVLATYSLVATQALAGFGADTPLSAGITAYSGPGGGANLASAPITATTDVVSASPVPSVVAETSPAAVAKGQTIAFDVSLALPAGVVPNLVIAPVLPGGASRLDYVSASVVSLGAGLSAGTPTIGSDGSVHFGTVQASASASAADDTAVVRFVLRADGTASGTALLQTVVSADSASAPGGTWSETVPSSVGVIVPPSPPSLSGLVAGQSVTTTTSVSPFGQFAIAASGAATSGTVVVTLGQASLGRLSTSGPGTLDAAGTTFSDSGSLAQLQADVRQLRFSGAAQGVEGFTVTVVDSAGGVAQDGSTSVTVGPPSSPDPLFDAAYYLAQNPDVAAGGGNPLAHFEAFGWREGRQPSLVFSDTTYLSKYPDIQAAGVNPLQHFIQFGLHEGRVATPVGFDGNVAAADPLVNATMVFGQLHASLAVGGAVGDAQAAELFHAGLWRTGVTPDAWFDPAYYLSRYPDIAAANIDPLAHYEAFGWREGRDPSLAFSTSGYLAANPAVQASGTNPLVQFITTGQANGMAAVAVGGTAPADTLVDPAYYDRQLGAVIVPQGAAGAQQATFGYNATGWQAGLNPDRWFNTNYYLANNPDVAAAHINPLLHYEVFGWHEGRNPSASFSTSKYLAAYPDVAAANIDPLAHYVQFGQAEGRQAFTV